MTKTGLGVGTGFGVGVGFGVGLGVGFGVGFGVGLGVGPGDCWLPSFVLVHKYSLLIPHPVFLVQSFATSSRVQSLAETLLQ